MDSFFAAAENLDHLLDELEEEEDDSVKSKSTGVKSKVLNAATVKYVDNDLPPTNLLELQTDQVTVISNPKNDQATTPDLKFDEGNKTETPSLISLEPPADPFSEFVVVQNNGVSKDAVSNTELLLDLFRAAPSASSDLEDYSYKGYISPLNPFMTDLIPTNPSISPSDTLPTSAKDTETSSDVNISISESGNVFQPSNVMDTVNNDINSTNAIRGVKNTNSVYQGDLQSVQFVAEEPSTLLKSAPETLGHSSNSESWSPANENVDTQLSPLPNEDSNSSLVPQETSNSSSAMQEDVVASMSGFSQEVSEEFEKFWNVWEKGKQENTQNTTQVENVMSAMSGTNLEDIVLTNITTSSPTSMPKHTPDNVYTDKESRVVEPTLTPGNSERLSIDDTINEHLDDTQTFDDPGATGSHQEDQEQDEGVEMDDVLMAVLPENVRISDQEYERFLSETDVEDGVTVSNDVVMDTETYVDINVLPVAESVGFGNDGRRGQNSPSETGSEPRIPNISSSRDDPQNSITDDSDRPLSLNIETQRNRDTDSVSSYPVTPPPPYTEEMHSVFQHSNQETRSTADGQAEESAQGLLDAHMAPVVQFPPQNPEDDGFSFLPSAILQSITRPGETKPDWIPDSDAPQCSNCANKFTFTRRRHHCRACGRVFCAACCGSKSPLHYLEYREARVCSMCSLAIMQADALAELSKRAAQASPAPLVQNAPPVADPQSGAEIENSTELPAVPLPVMANGQDEQMVDAQDEQIDEADEVTASLEEEVLLPERQGPEGAAARTLSTKSVRFSDGTRPKHPDEMPSTPPPPSRTKRVRRRHAHHSRDPNSPDGKELPPIIIAHGENGTYAVEENPDMNVVIGLLESGGPNPQSFVLNPNLITHVRFVSYANRLCWCFWTEGLDGVGQRDVVFLLEREGLGDRLLPQDAFTLFNCIYDRARKGKIFNNTDFMPMSTLGLEDEEEMFGLKENAGFLFVQPTSQSLDGLISPKRKDQSLRKNHSGMNGTGPLRSMLFIILVQKTEAPWATLFPMRLILRLGMEMKQYPCPLFSVRRRQPVFHQLGHTILAILCDFRNFKYRVVSVPGLRVVASSSGSISIQIPCNRFGATIKIMNSSNESVLAIGTGTFGPILKSREEGSLPLDSPCDSHLVCVQDPKSSNYHTEVMCMKNVQPTYTGAAFVIFNGSLKSDGVHQAKCAVVEDGIMVQLLPEKMEELRASLRSMEDFSIDMGPNAPPTPAAEAPSFTQDTPKLVEIDEPPTPTQTPVVEVRWVDDDTAFNIGMFSPIDGTGFEGVVGFNVQGRSEQKGKKHTLRWNQVFFLASTSDPLDMSRLAEQVANGCFLALTPVLQELVKHRQHKVAVRVTIHPENVGYVAGSRCKALPPECMNALDENLIPTIHNAAVNVPVEQEAVIIELLFSILLLRPGYRTA